jgi:hypothetical protein
MALVAAVPEASAYEPPTKRPTVQPGSLLFVPDDEGRCTLGYLLKDRTGAIYGVTWGNCPADQSPGGGQVSASAGSQFLGVRSWEPGRGPVVKGYNPRVQRIGRFVLQVARADNDDLQYSLVRLDRAVVYDGTVGLIGGPASVALRGATSAPATVDVVGHDGYQTDTVGGPQGYDDGHRQVAAYEGLRETSFRLATAATLDQGGAPVSLSPGDGSPIAVGILSGRVGTGATVGNEDGRAVGAVVYRLDAILEDASARLRTRLELLGEGATGRVRR